MGTKIIYHGSTKIIKNPEYGKGKEYNDYGRGFYCTEHLDLAKEWACSENTPGFANKYQIDFDGLSILDLSESKYTILHWLALLVNNRKFRISTPIMKKGVEWLTNNYLIDLSNYDIVIGYRADDSYFSFARSFLNNEISLSQLSSAMTLGKLGQQIVLISPKAFGKIKFISYEVSDNSIFYAKKKYRDEKARLQYNKLLELDVLDDLFIRDLIRLEVKDNDPRLQ